MKTIRSFLVLALFISPILSCDELDKLDELEELLEIDLPISFVMDINNIAVLEGSTDNRFYNIGFYDLLSNSDVTNEVGTPEQIKKVVINSVEYQYRNFSGNVDAIVSGNMGFNEVDESDDDYIYFDTQPVNVSVASITTEMFNLQGAQGFNLLIGNGIVNVDYSGDSTGKPIQFDTRVFVNATLTLKVD